MHFNNITRLYGSIYARLPCKPGKKAACLREGDYEAGQAITHVQTHVQSGNCSSRARSRFGADILYRIEALNSLVFCLVDLAIDYTYILRVYS